MDWIDFVAAASFEKGNRAHTCELESLTQANQPRNIGADAGADMDEIDCLREELAALGQKETALRQTSGVAQSRQYSLPLQH